MDWSWRTAELLRVASAALSNGGSTVPEALATELEQEVADSALAAAREEAAGAKGGCGRLLGEQNRAHHKKRGKSSQH